MAAITRKKYLAIRKDAQSFEGSQVELAARHEVSERTIRKVLSCATWKAFQETTAADNERRRSNRQKQKAVAAAQDDRVEMPPVDDLVIACPDGPVVKGPVAADPGQLSPEVCGWIREACGFGVNEEIRGIIGALACYSPDHFAEHMALLHDSLGNRE